MKDSFDKTKEKANSYFQLAQLFAVIAGFLMIANSVYIDRAVADGSWFMSKYDAASVNWSAELAHNGQAYQLVTMMGANKMKADAFFFISIIFGVASLVTWFKGKKLIDSF